MSWIGSGPRLVGRIGSEVRVSDSFHILSCAVVRAVARSCGQVLATPDCNIVAQTLPRQPTLLTYLAYQLNNYVDTQLERADR